MSNELYNLLFLGRVELSDCGPPYSGYCLLEVSITFKANRHKQIATTKNLPVACRCLVPPNCFLIVRQTFVDELIQISPARPPIT